MEILDEAKALKAEFVAVAKVILEEITKATGGTDNLREEDIEAYATLIAYSMKICGFYPMFRDGCLILIKDMTEMNS